MNLLKHKAEVDSSTEMEMQAEMRQNLRGRCLHTSPESVDTTATSSPYVGSGGLGSEKGLFLQSRYVRRHPMSKLTLLTALLLIGANSIAAPNLQELLRAGQFCTQTKFEDSPTCGYTIGKDLHFTITGVGAKNVTVFVTRVTEKYTVGVRVGDDINCVIVTRGEWPHNGGEIAFVSRKDGKVYDTSKSCGATSTK